MHQSLNASLTNCREIVKICTPQPMIRMDYEL
jgi:hypothetical protein